MNESRFPHPPIHPRILCLWLPNWPIQRLIVDQPELRRQRVVLFRHDARRGRLVSAVSPLAHRDGIRSQMPLSEAKSLLRRSCEAFHLFEHHLDADQAALEALADGLALFSPIVGLESIEPDSQPPAQRAEAILLDVTGLATLFGGEASLANQLYRHCHSLGYLTYVAIANTPGMAIGAAKFLRHPDPPISIIAVDDSSTFAALPVAALRLPATILQTLRLLGLQTISQLLPLPRAELAVRLGDSIHRRLDQASGKLLEPIIARQNPVELSATQLLEYPTHHRETIAAILQRLIAELCRQLRVRQRGALQWTVRLIPTSGAPLLQLVNLFEATANAEHVMPMIEMQLEQLLQPHTRHSRRSSGRTRVRYTTIDIQEIQVDVTISTLLVEQQRQLFDESPRLDKQALAQLINRLTARLGPTQVVYPTLQSAAQPEYSYRFRPLVNMHTVRSRRRSRVRASSHLPGRPLRIFPVAVALQPTPNAASNRNDSQPPAQFRLSAALPMKFLKLIHAWGPERIETGWWRGRTIRRDYWRVEIDTGQQLWIYRDLQTQAWLLQGEF